ncbi:ribosome biogenesis GTP-binding protein YihA/YsxC [Labilibaculum sp. DW002]|uniref:Probable GTP-binding protein EngB n=1 Tax=Paralabilibaculum antarcticum TaxID=2912572 RepID=A0ABT5VRN3_9BACT|nr:MULTISPECIES: ribosome biogenesis GTP-binding protein YihA/YsxC [unclassified Labilibaculum]MBI9056466.1 YihA family ribosome biogenesis GTP-binding protein [Labilibaculum sp.]MDE5418085.1 ribosome biogenesis GTP-binding protein YihA/YsxC [Labilibaculum sp. DW002]
MNITSAQFVMSNSDISKCPTDNKAEYAFIGRSNVGKSSLINMLTNNKSLAKISVKPGKTQLVNHFIINKEWYLVDLPGYGFAKVAKNTKQRFSKLIFSYIESRTTLINLFVLVDCRHEPQNKDVDFMEWLGVNGIPFSIIFTKADKLSKQKLKDNVIAYEKELLTSWEEMPPYFISSASSGLGKDEILNYIEETNKKISL